MADSAKYPYDDLMGGVFRDDDDCGCVFCLKAKAATVALDFMEAALKRPAKLRMEMTLEQNKETDDDGDQ